MDKGSKAKAMVAVALVIMFLSDVLVFSWACFTDVSF